jgi:hypothetical protein
MSMPVPGSGPATDVHLSAKYPHGLTLNDTPFNDDAAIEEHLETSITLADALNFLVER